MNRIISLRGVCKSAFYQKATKKNEKENSNLFGEKYRIKHLETCEKTAQVIMNGPSLSDNWGKIDPKHTIISANGYIDSDYFSELKPDYHIIVDPKYANMISFLEKINQCLKSGDISKLVITPIICRSWVSRGYDMENVLVINNLPSPANYNTNRDLEAYRENLRAPIFMTVAIAALYLAIQIGCNTIELFGNDFNYLQSLKVDNNCDLIFEDSHYYGNTSVNVTQRDGVHLIDELRAEVSALEGYYQVKEYAKDMGVQIFNMSPQSMLDMFEKVL